MSISEKSNFPLAPWGSPMLITSEYVSEDARRAGEGLLIWAFYYYLDSLRLFHIPLQHLKAIT